MTLLFKNECIQKSKINAIRHRKYIEKRKQIINASEIAMNEFNKLILAEKARKKTKLDKLDDAYKDIAQSTDNFNVRLLNRNLIKFHIECTSSEQRQNCNDFKVKWNAQFVIRRGNIHINDRSDLQEFKRAFVDFNAFCSSDYLVIAKAKFCVIQMERIHARHGRQRRNKLFAVYLAKAMHFFEDSSIFGTDFMMSHPVSNIVLIEAVETNPRLRGSEYGRNLVQRICDNFGCGNTRFLLKPVPLKVHQEKQKMIDIWESIGFEKIQNTEYWGRRVAFGKMSKY